MSSYEATPAELEQYGAGLNIWQQIALLQAWSPLIGYGQRLVNESDPYKKSIIVAEAAEWLASKTDAKADDQLVRLLGDIIRTPQGEAVVRWALLQVEAVR
jgi:hypothetical protein